MKLSGILKNLKWKLFYFDYDLTSEVFKGDREFGKSYKDKSFARSLYRNNIRYMRRDPQGDILVFKMPNGILAGTNRNWGIFSEIFISKLYELEDKYTQQPFALFDVGLHRGYTSLFFSSYENCKVIFGYEPHPQTYKFAQYNRTLNEQYLTSKQIICNFYNFGLGKESAKAPMLQSSSDGISTLVGCKNAAFDVKNQFGIVEVDIADATQEISTRMNEIDHLCLKKILKIDVEGAEYDIFDSLCKSGQINSFDLIIGDAHNGLSKISNQLANYGFELIHHGYGMATCEEFIFVNHSWE